MELMELIELELAQFDSFTWQTKLIVLLVNLLLLGFSFGVSLLFNRLYYYLLEKRLKK